MFRIEVQRRVQQDHASALAQLRTDLCVDAVTPHQKLEVYPDSLARLRANFSLQPLSEASDEGDQYVILTVRVTDETTVFERHDPVHLRVENT